MFPVEEVFQLTSCKDFVLDFWLLPQYDEIFALLGCYTMQIGR